MSAPAVKLQLRNVSKSFGVNGRSLPVLEGLDFHAGVGEFVSVIGPSGCGKSTMLNIVAGLEQPDTGSVDLDGATVDERLGLVGYMHQKDLLMPWRTVIGNAILGLELRGVSRKDARTRALELVDLFGLRGFEEQYPYSLSGGMRQRAAFLRTVLVSQEVMLLDEPFGALDAITRTRMQEWLMELWDSLQRTIVLVTHDVDEALLLSDRVYVMTGRPGRVKSVIEVNLPRPRVYEMVTQDYLVTLKAEMVAALREDHLPLEGELNP